MSIVALGPTCFGPQACLDNQTAYGGKGLVAIIIAPTKPIGEGDRFAVVCAPRTSNREPSSYAYCNHS
jgi:hypothetical protein